LRDVMTEQVRLSGGQDVNVTKWLSRAALECIGQGGLGYAFHALDDTKSDSYSETLKRLGPAYFSLLLYRQFLPYLSKIGSPRFRRAVVDAVQWWGTLQELKDVSDKLHNITKEIYGAKVAALEKGDGFAAHQIGQGKDIMSVLLKANLSASEEDKLPDDEVFGQMNGLIFAAHDTATSAMSRILHLLALNQDAQKKLREEVTAARNTFGGDLNYDTLTSLPYLDAVCRETLRVYPPLTHFVRTTSKDIVLPLLWPIKSADGKLTINEIPLRKNTNVIGSILGANRCVEIWGPDGEDWKPERWLKHLPESVSKARLPGVYSYMMTFIGGGRACIGFKFAEMEMKLILSVLLEKFAFHPGQEEIFWNMGGVASPVVKDSKTNYPQLPLKVTFIDGE